jgi:hypothetical protein
MQSVGVLEERRPKAAYGHLLPQGEKGRSRNSPVPTPGSPSDLPDGRIAQIRVQPFAKKYFTSPVGQIKSTTRAIPSRKRGVAHVINAGRDAMDAGGARDVRAASAFAKASADWRKPRRSLWRRRARTAKSCGPDTPTLVSSFRGKQFPWQRRWQQSPVTGESTK